MSKAYAVQQTDGYWVGIWGTLSCALNVLSKTRHDANLVVMYTEDELGKHESSLKVEAENVRLRDELDKHREERKMIIQQLKICSEGGTIEPKLWAKNFRNSLLLMPITPPAE